MTTRTGALPCALAIGGLDPSGGAGILADVRAFEHAGAFGCAAAAVLTIQSTAGLRDVRVVPAKDVVAQASEILKNQRVVVVKTGALGSVENVRAVAKLMAKHPSLPLIVDPVMLPTRGAAKLLTDDATAALRKLLIPLATLVIANAHEASVLTGLPVTSAEYAAIAARAFVAMGAKGALIKAGHLEDDDAIDVLYTDKKLSLLGTKRLALPELHGTGCTFASLIAGKLAKSPKTKLLAAVRWARAVHHEALRHPVDVGGPLRVLLF